jgi:hypothetical protein
MTQYIPKPGDYFTISPNKTICDRSYSRDLLCCEAVNEGHILATLCPNQANTKNAIILVKTEHDFFEASDIAKKFLELKLKE